MARDTAPRFGDRAPDFELFRPDGSLVRLADLITDRVLVLFFYPRDETLGCRIEACAFRDAYLDFTAAGAEVVGVSRDGGESHERFIAAHDLPFPLLTDRDGHVHEKYGVKSQLGGMLSDRTTYIIDRAGIVRLVFNSRLRFAKHAAKTLELVRALQDTPGPAQSGRVDRSI
jgi:thioredoxin-dependent peroxiredoxin